MSSSTYPKGEHSCIAHAYKRQLFLHHCSRKRLSTIYDAIALVEERHSVECCSDMGSVFARQCNHTHQMSKPLRCFLGMQHWCLGRLQLTLHEGLPRERWRRPRTAAPSIRTQRGRATWYVQPFGMYCILYCTVKSQSTCTCACTCTHTDRYPRICGLSTAIPGLYQYSYVPSHK